MGHKAKLVGHVRQCVHLGYATVFKPLTKNVPAFCLSCVGTDNIKFNAELVLTHWRYIYSELQKRNIHLMSYAANMEN